MFIFKPYYVCINTADSGGTVVLVGQDGVQRPPIHFPKGGHMLAFLSCMENGLLPRGQLDPPLWSQRGKGSPTYRKGGQTACCNNNNIYTVIPTSVHTQINI